MNDSANKKVLHVGSGVKKPGRLHPSFESPEWTEIRLDINPAARPDLIASITNMDIVESGTMDALYSSHNLEHLLPHEVPIALREFRRVLKKTGYALITLPDLQTVAEIIAKGGIDQELYTSPMGPVTPLDVLYGHKKALQGGNLFMLHKTGFTQASLARLLREAGFAVAEVRRDPKGLSLWAMAHVTAAKGAKKAKQNKKSKGPFGND